MVVRVFCAESRNLYMNMTALAERLIYKHVRLYYKPMTIASHLTDEKMAAKPNSFL